MKGEIKMKREVRKTVHYYHHGDEAVAVHEEDKGKHRNHCLCWQCGMFFPWDMKLHCTIAKILYSLCVIFNITTPVWECPDYSQADEMHQKQIDEFENK